jgi:hypothetical protein
MAPRPAALTGARPFSSSPMMNDTTVIVALIMNIAAVVIALAALAFTIRESRRNNGTVLRVVESAHEIGTFFSEAGPNEHNRYCFTIRNFGIALYNVQVSLEYDMPTGGIMRVMLRAPSPANASGAFHKGTIGRFYLDRLPMPNHTRLLAQHLKDPRRQRAVFCLYAQGFLVGTFPIGDWRDRTRQNFNEAIMRCHDRLPGNIRTFLSDRTGLPRLMFTVLEFQLKSFLDLHLSDEQKVSRAA